MQKGKNQTITRDINLMLIMNAYIRHPMSRVDISRKFKLSKPAASKIVFELESLNLIRPCKGEIYRNIPGVVPQNFELNYDFGLIGVLDLSSPEVKISLCNFGSELIFEKTFSNMDTIKYKDLVSFCDCLENLLQNSNIINLPLLSVCVALPCATNKITGEIYWSARFDMSDDFDFFKYLYSRFNTKIIIKNDVHLYLLGEKHKGLITDEKSYALLAYIDAGIGGGFYIKGHFDGETGSAGDIGFFPVLDNGEIILLDSAGSINAIKNKLNRKLKNTINSFYDPSKRIHFQDIKKAYLNEDTMTVGVVNETAKIVANALCSLIEILNINFIIINGRIVQLGDKYLNVLQNEINIKLPFVEVKFSALAANAVKEGAMMICLDEILKDQIDNRKGVN